jgi:hypothetical protein
MLLAALVVAISIVGEANAKETLQQNEDSGTGDQLIRVDSTAVKLENICSFSLLFHHNAV